MEMTIRLCTILLFIIGTSLCYDGKLSDGVWGTKNFVLRVQDGSAEVEWNCAVATFSDSLQVKRKLVYF
jgi:hypothetical protein